MYLFPPHSHLLFDSHAYVNTIQLYFSRKELEILHSLFGGADNLW